MKAQYRIRNWSEYNAGLKQRGSLSFWLDEAVLETWYNPSLSGKPGASNESSDLAIITFVTLKSRKDAVRQHGNCNAPPHQRDENLRYIRKHGRKKWKRDSGYHRRSLAETTMFRFKAIFGGNLSSRTFDHQAVELFITGAALNRVIQIAKPVSYPVKA